MLNDTDVGWMRWIQENCARGIMPQPEVIRVNANDSDTGDNGYNTARCLRRVISI